VNDVGAVRVSVSVRVRAVGLDFGGVRGVGHQPLEQHVVVGDGCRRGI
jgi:hypothetical protein